MDVTDAILGRRSTAAITDVAPDDQQLRDYVAIAAHAPDHAALRPWRLVTVRGPQRARLGAAMSVGFGDVPGSAAEQRTLAKTLRAPLLIGIVASPTPHPKVPRWEQVAAVVAMVTSLQLVMFAHGWVTFWRTGPATELAEVREVMGAAETEQLLGWLYTGRQAGERGVPAGDPAPGAALDLDLDSRLITLPDPS